MDTWQELVTPLDLLSIGLLNHGARGRTPAYLWVIGMAVCGDKDTAALATIWADNLKVCGPFVVC